MLCGRKPIRATLRTCCAPAASGQAAAAPPTSVMNCRRLMASILAETTPYHMLDRPGRRGRADRSSRRPDRAPHVPNLRIEMIGNGGLRVYCTHFDLSQDRDFALL